MRYGQGKSLMVAGEFASLLTKLMIAFIALGWRGKRY